MEREERAPTTAFTKTGTSERRRSMKSDEEEAEAEAEANADIETPAEDGGKRERGRDDNEARPNVSKYKSIPDGWLKEKGDLASYWGGKEGKEEVGVMRMKASVGTPCLGAPRCQSAKVGVCRGLFHLETAIREDAAVFRGRYFLGCVKRVLLGTSQAHPGEMTCALGCSPA